MLSSRSVGISVLAIGLLTAGLVSGTAVVDPDSDGVTPVRELRDGTAVFASDTDGDGLDDGEEKQRGTDPTVADTDGDGLDDGAEFSRHDTDPTDADTDDDGLDDGEEITTHETDPELEDTDGDGLTDSAEVEEYGTNPLTTDSDDDELTDGDELETYDTDPTDADTDGDGLNDSAEATEYDTDPLVADTDDDGLSDGAEIHRRDLFPDADPLRTDIYVEIDAMEGTELGRTQTERIAAEFDDAPLENPDGSTGISLHFVYDETIPWEPSTSMNDLNGYRVKHFDRARQGYHYLAIVANVGGDSGTTNVIGKARRGTMMIEPQSDPDEMGSTAMHELGHSLGLFDSDFEGIDSEQYGFWRYRSVMNYNAPPEYYGFSSSGLTGFDDWEYFDDHMYTPSTDAVTVSP
ncbi:hypothetical protein [Natrinema sp. 1APR25-10V2]|uniref:hypothetical protein n=1 Tax=Natrinema sp. 1APR25-10V2 TaxID=2951081 RepID=UPI002874BE82|nr:hypothetical protein [Natrinema sp. 1APR25-10V2]MDS0475568.1 hypothetical protein [Natrinema sp. 1APR25-10V2]